MRIVRALACAVTLGLTAPGVAAASVELYAPSDEAALAPRPFARPLHDDVLGGATGTGARASAARVPMARASAQRFYASNGQGPIAVDLSASFGRPTRARVQPFVDFLASRPHGSELGRLTVFIVTLEEIKRLCTAQALACYIPSQELIIVPGEQTPPGEVPLEYVITHEYGHHIAANRNNDPWPAVSWGPKAWATQEGICAGVARRRYFPGDEDQHYVNNPGENWAEAYAQYKYPGQVRWQYDPTLAPDAAALAAIARDVTQPWRHNVAVRRSGRLSGARRSQTFGVRTTLDGRLKLSLRGPRDAQFDLQVVNRGRVALRSREPGSRDVLTGTDCARRFAVRVVRRSGSGRFSLRISTAG